MNLEPTTLATRLPVWTALSELFLDTELDAHDLARIAQVLAQSPYATSEIESILRDEVLPAFGGNLLSTAGEWQPWAPDDVLAIMTRSLGRRLPARWLGRILASMQWGMVEDDWRGLRALLR